MTILTQVCVPKRAEAIVIGNPSSLKRVADRHCPIALVTEGGYDLDALAACLDATVALF